MSCSVMRVHPRAEGRFVVVLLSVWGLVVAALCVALNGFFVAAEFALVKVRQPASLTGAGAGQKGDCRRVDRRSTRPVPVGHAVRDHARQPRSGLDRRARHGRGSRSGRSYRMGAPGSPGDAHRRRRGRLAILTFGHVLLGELVPGLVAIQRSEGTALAAAIPLGAPLHLLPHPVAPRAVVGAHLAFRGAVARRGGSRGPLQPGRDPRHLAASAARSPRGRVLAELLERVMRFSQRAARLSHGAAGRRRSLRCRPPAPPPTTSCGRTSIRESS